MEPRQRRAGWRIGIDLGGTWMRLVAFDAAGRRRDVRAPSPGLDGLPVSLERLWRRWGLRREQVDMLVVASRGVWTASEKRRRSRPLRALARRVRVMSDVEAAYLGALGERAGIVLLAGTGSMALARDGRGRWIRAGGLGPLLGDEGSAFWIGRQWLARTDAFGRVRRILASPDPVPRIAALAPGVLRRARRGSGLAQDIARGAHDALARLVVETTSALPRHGPIIVSWAGSLLGDPRFRRAVWRAVRRRGARIEPRAPRESAAAAVARLAVNADRGTRPPPRSEGIPSQN
ncbi:MAG: hypothetical protein C5B48_08045 [Candidatus Rokuibacteriota bacterium]|nr:MAG: hypothetical protein C5B48_08045 [Candidatus Rokubacteria bacterium]